MGKPAPRSLSLQRVQLHPFEGPRIASSVGVRRGASLWRRGHEGHRQKYC